MASCDVLKITVSGQGGHGALPHLNNDVILAASCIVQALTVIPARDVNT